MSDIAAIHRSEYESDDDQCYSLTIAEAPGRIHYLGEHGEADAGLYLSSAIDRYVRVAVSFRNDSSLRFYHADLNERKRSSMAAPISFKKSDDWANYIKAAVTMFASMGYVTRGLNFTVSGDIPRHIGLASSAAMEAAAALALDNLYQAHIKVEDLPGKMAAAQKAFWGAPENSVDYIVMFQARKDELLIVDEKDLSLRGAGCSFINSSHLFVVNSNAPCTAMGNELEHLRKELAQGLELLSPGKEKRSFRDFMPGNSVELAGNMGEEVRKRCLHVVEELRRVHDVEEALVFSKLPDLSRILFTSHWSLRDLYEISCPEVDWIVKRAQETPGILGARMFGKGFGGCVFGFASQDSAIDVFKRNLEDYERIFGFKPVFYEFNVGDGARVIAPRGQ
jgi:galactokinase